MAACGQCEAPSESGVWNGNPRFSLAKKPNDRYFAYFEIAYKIYFNMINEILALSTMCAPYMAPTAIQQILKVESTANIYAIGINGKNKLPRQPADIDEAIATFQYLHEKNIAFGAGAMQIDSQHHKRLGWTENPAKAFDVCQNLAIGHNIFVECYNRAVKIGYKESISNNQVIPNSDLNSAYPRALSCYNTGGFNNGITNGYVQKALNGQFIQPSSLIGHKATPAQTILRKQKRFSSII
jgi:hypothetical protein